MRPQWDAAVLINNGYSKIMIEQNIGKVVWDEEEQINYASTLMFMIMAEKIIFMKKLPQIYLKLENVISGVINIPSYILQQLLLV